MGMLLYEAAGYRRDEEMVEYLISSYSDVININIQDEVSIAYCIMIMNVCTYWIVIIV